MNISHSRNRNRRAISPVLATVILIAITLIAAIAIAGFVFGLFGSFTSSAQVSASVVNVAHGLSGVALATTCANAPSTNYILVQNTGTSNSALNSVQISYGGVSSSAAPTNAGNALCTVTAGGKMYLTITNTGLTVGTAGEQFVGSLSMSNGASVPFTGTFT